jgi:tetratricopeptide (TPR) repeat protein
MNLIISLWKAPWTRLVLATGAFLLFIPQSFSQYDFNENCQQAYEAIISLRFAEARKLINHEKQVGKDNLVPVYLENYIDFLTLIIGEERKVYNQLKGKKGGRVDVLETGDKDSPYYNFCLGEVHLQWAIARLKFGDYTTAAFEIHNANTCFLANEAKFPAFLLNKTGMGVVHVIASLVPDNYKWVGSLVGLDGSMELGLSEISQVAFYSGPDKIIRMYKTQASFFLAFLTLNLQKNKKEALPFLSLLTPESFDDHQSTSPLLIYTRATILMKNGLNDEALTVLQGRSYDEQAFRFYFLDYLEGMARLNKLDNGACVNFERFLEGFHGSNYKQAACQKLAWMLILRGDSAGYFRRMNQLLSLGSPVVDEDKQADYEARTGVAPNIILLRARLLFDGGYYDLAIKELLNHSVKTIVKSKSDLVEYTYRLGRIYHETGNMEKALDNYQQTVTRGKTEPYYFAASAAYQMGLLYENMGLYAKADSAYCLCLSIKPVEYKTSLHQKAKAGLKRLKTGKPKI